MILKKNTYSMFLQNVKILVNKIINKLIFATFKYISLH